MEVERFGSEYKKDLMLCEKSGTKKRIAGLVARGRAIVSGFEHLDREYEDFERKLRELGANIRRI